MTQTTSHLHTPKINRIDIYDGIVFNNLSDFLGWDEDTTVGKVRFIPPGVYTASDGEILLPTDGYYHLKGASGPLWGSDGNIFGSSHGYDLGITEIVNTDSGGLFNSSQTASITYANISCFEGIQFVQDTNTLSSEAVAYFDIIRTLRFSMKDCGIFNRADDLGGCALYITGSSEVNLKNVHVSGFGNSSTDDSIYGVICARLCELVNIDGFDYTNFNNQCSGIFSFQDVQKANLQNINVESVGKTTSKSYFLKTTGSTVVSNISINNIRFSYWDATGTQLGIFKFNTTNSFVTVDNAFSDHVGGKLVFDDNGANVGRVHLRGYMGTGTTGFPVPTGVISSPFDSAYYLITPRAYTSASAPVASTNYTVSMRTCEMEVRGGTGVVPTISAVARKYDSTNGTNYYLNPGDVVNFGAFTVAPTVSVKFNP